MRTYWYFGVWAKPELRANAVTRSADESQVRSFSERRVWTIDLVPLRLNFPAIFMKFLIDRDGDIFMSLKIPELHHALTLPCQLSPAAELFRVLLNCLVFVSAG